MKLHQLAVGARFEYAGQTYVKTGPITASAEQGGTQMIPRHATLKPLDLPSPTITPGLAARKLDPQRVRKAFDVFYGTAEALVDSSKIEQLQIARSSFLASLK